MNNSSGSYFSLLEEVLLVRRVDSPRSAKIPSTCGDLSEYLRGNRPATNRADLHNRARFNSSSAEYIYDYWSERLSTSKNNKHKFVSRVSIFCWTCFHFSERFKTLSWTGSFRNSILWTKQWNQIVIANDNLRNDAQFDFTSNDLMLSSNDKCQYILISIAKYSFENYHWMKILKIQIIGLFLKEKKMKSIVVRLILPPWLSEAKEKTRRIASL